MARTRLEATEADVNAVTRVAHEYIESYAVGDAERHARVFHPECLKRRYVTDDASGVTELVTLSPLIMADYAAASGPMDADASRLTVGPHRFAVTNHSPLLFITTPAGPA